MLGWGEAALVRGVGELIIKFDELVAELLPTAVEDGNASLQETWSDADY